MDAQQATSMVDFGAANSANTNVGGEHPNVNTAPTAATTTRWSAGLRALGHTVIDHRAVQRRQHDHAGAVNGSDVWQGGADPRREGLVLGVRLHALRPIVQYRAANVRGGCSGRAAAVGLRLMPETAARRHPWTFPQRRQRAIPAQASAPVRKVRRRLLAARCDDEARFPRDFHRAMAEGGWLGITMPEARRRGPGCDRSRADDAHRRAPRRRHGRGVGRTHQHVRPASDRRASARPSSKARWIPPLVPAPTRPAFGVTEPNAGLDTTSITTFASKVPGGYR